MVQRFLIATMIITALGWQCIGAWQDSQTTDEAVHLTSGRAYWQNGAFFLNPEHPSLFKLWAAAPLTMLQHGQVDTDTRYWQERNQWTIGASYLYLGTAQEQYGGRVLMFFGRIPMILIWLGLMITIASIAWKYWGSWPAVAATAAAVFDPNLLGHGHLVTNDVATAFAYLGTVMLTARFARRPSWNRLLLLAAVFGVAQLTKYSMVFLWAVVPATLFFFRRQYPLQLPWRWIRRSILLLIVATGLTAWLAYGGNALRPLQDTRIHELIAERADLIQRDALSTVPAYTQFFVRLTRPGSITGYFAKALENVPIPGYWYFRGLFSAASHNAYGHGAYLLGHLSETGWWYYFPVALAVKTPLLTLGAVIAMCILWLRKFVRTIKRYHTWKTTLNERWWLFGAIPLIYLLWSMTSHLNIGMRHVFPTYVFFPFAIAACISLVERPYRRFVPGLTLGISLSIFLVTLAAWPNTIGYFNAIAGGTDGGHRFVLDSNMDWNQDIWRVREYLDAQHYPEVHAVLFGSIPLDRIFPEALAVPENDAIARGERPSGIVIISAGQKFRVEGPFSWLNSYQPMHRIGSSIYVYDFR